MWDSTVVRVRAAAKSLGDGVQEFWPGIIHSEAGEPGWRGLLELLGNNDDDDDQGESSIDILNKPCHTIVSICVENELPKHLVRCLRMLRMLEIQRARKGAVASISTRATAKVSKLLCRLCTDESVGEEFRPHLFGLLALPGAPYPGCGLHVSDAASAVIVAYSKHCLSQPLVEFLHDRKMIVLMVEDIKDLCGMSENASPSAKYYLNGDGAEKAGLWVVAFRAVVNLVVHSLHHHDECLLMEDFKSAGGDQVLSYAIEHSNNPQHAKELLVLKQRLQTDATSTRVRVAARNLANEIQMLVMAAKRAGGQNQVQQGEWMPQLLALLGGRDDQSSKESNIDILLDNSSSCDNIVVLLCVDSDVPPNLVQCLRQLRVLELQRAKERDEQGGAVVTPISTRATAKVSKLLCFLCADESVGEQLRPHLFGLLALPGASYPGCGLHIAKAASAVIVAYSEHCLSPRLVEFIHERKVIGLMVEDIKELCGMSENASPSAKYCLNGDAAEKAGLWLVAFRAVVNLVVHSSLHHHEYLLMEDFKSAGGDQVLSYAIEHSNNPQHGKELVELQAALTTKKQHQVSNTEQLMMLGYFIMLVLGYAVVRQAMPVYWGVADTQ